MIDETLRARRIRRCGVRDGWASAALRWICVTRAVRLLGTSRLAMTQ